MTAVISGPALGGASLTSRLWTSESPVAAKVLVTPIALAAGTVAGPLVAMPRGMNRDLEGPQWFEVDGYVDVLDPFEAGLFEAPAPVAAAEDSPGEEEHEEPHE